MTKHANHVWFSGDGAPDLLISRVDESQAARLARPILRVLSGAYQRQYEDELGILPPGSASEYFAADNAERIRQQEERMQTYIKAGSTYWVASLGRYVSPGDIVGIVKTSPSRPSLVHKLRITPANCYINDIAVTVPRKGIGSALLKVALDDYDPALSVAVADALPGSEPFFEAAAMYSVETLANQFAPLEIGSVALHEQMTRYESTFSGLMKYGLMTHNEWIASGSPLN